VTGWWCSFSIVLTHAHPSWKRALGRVLQVLLILAIGAAIPLCFYQYWDADFWYARGAVLYQQGHPKEAIGSLEKAAQLNPNVSFIGPFYQLLAQHYYAEENFDKTLLYGRRAAAYDPSQPYVHEWLERSYRISNNEPAAEMEAELYIEALAYRMAGNPNRPAHLNDLAYALAERRLHLDKALGLAVMANEKSGYRNIFYLDTLAWVLYQQKRYDRADEFMKPVLEKSQDPMFRFHRGAIWIGQGRIEEGRKEVQGALDEGLPWWERSLAEKLLAGAPAI